MFLQGIRTSSELTIPTYSVHELTLTTAAAITNEYTDVTLSGTWTHTDTTAITVLGFWDGGDNWKLRFAPTKTGTWTLTDVTSNDVNLDAQLEGAVIKARDPTDGEIQANEVLRHGFVGVSAKTYQFEHADGEPFFLMADTAWGGRSFLYDLWTDGDFQTIVDDKVSRGFTALGLCNIAVESAAGNEGGYPFTGTYTSEVLNPAFFQYVDLRIEYMTKKGLRPMIVIGAPDAGLTTTQTFLERITKYLIARYAAYDVFWMGVKEFEEWAGTPTTIIDYYGGMLTTHDPYNHPASTHTSNVTTALNAKTWLDFHSVQSATLADATALRTYNKPIFIAESHYEDQCSYAGTWSYSDDDAFLIALWNYYINNIWMGGHYITCAPIATFIANLDTPSVNYHTYLANFMTQTDFHDLVAHNELVVSGSGSVLAHDTGSVTGTEYLVFLSAGGDITLDLSDGAGTVNYAWYNPKTNVYAEQSTKTASASVAFTSPGGTMLVLYITTGAAPSL